MSWNWELPDWPRFSYNAEKIAEIERQFLLGMGSASAYLKTVDEQEYKRFIVEILSWEGTESSKIEGEFLDRESLQSSIKQHFGIHDTPKHKSDKETGMAEVLCDVFETYDEPLTHEMLWKWHEELFKDSRLDDHGKYRTHAEPMQIVSNRHGAQKVYFEAPPSARIHKEMTAFINWFNSSRSSGSILGRSAIIHIYFESIHPFEDGNGRIGRVLSEKALSQGVSRPILITISKTLEKKKKAYYAALETCNRSLDAEHWVEFFSEVILEAHEDSMRLLYFIIGKSKMLTGLAEQLNPRQLKVLLRMFEEGPEGFKGGLSAENYIAITKTTRATATRDLTDLVEKGALTKTGELRHTRYWLRDCR